MFKTRQTKLAFAAAALVALIAPPLIAAPEADKNLSKELDSLLKDSSSLTEIGPGGSHKTDSTTTTTTPPTQTPTTTGTQNNDSSFGITPSTSEQKAEPSSGTPAETPSAGTQSPTQPPPQSTTQAKPPQPPSPPKAPTAYLKGRLEEIGGSGAKLPVGVVLNLKTQTAKMDPAVEKKLEGRVASFPSDWTGSYGGTLTIWSAQWDPLAFKLYSETA
jgi:hypothetical protein